MYLGSSEEDPVAVRFLACGYCVAILHYGVKEKSEYPIPLLECYKAIYYLRCHNRELCINPDAIALCGFSAGAHLCGLAASQWHFKNHREALHIKSNSLIKPNAVILAYPIVDMGLLEQKDSKYLSKWGTMLNSPSKNNSVLENITLDMPPCFIWHTRTDGIVPVTQSIELIRKLEQVGCQYEAHIFFDGFHGLSTCDSSSNYRGAIQGGYVPANVELWVKMCENFINRLFDFN